MTDAIERLDGITSEVAHAISEKKDIEVIDAGDVEVVRIGDGNVIATLPKGKDIYVLKRLIGFNPALRIQKLEEVV